MGSSGLQEQKKWPTSDSLDPPWPPKMEAKFVKNRLVGDHESHFVDQSTDFRSILKALIFYLFFQGLRIEKLMILEGSNP